jgi:hypothetical protein
LMLRADPPGGALGHRFAGLSGLFDQVAVPELGSSLWASNRALAR